MLRSYASHHVLRKKQYRACTVVAHFLIGGPNSLCRQSREKGSNIFKTERFSFHFLKGRKRIPRAWFTPIDLSIYWGTKGRLAELILMLNILLKWKCHVIGPLKEKRACKYQPHPRFLEPVAPVFVFISYFLENMSLCQSSSEMTSCEMYFVRTAYI